MKLSEGFFYTLKEDAKNEESISGNLLTRSGMIKKLSNGVYIYMPLGYRVLSKIEKIIQEEMDKAGCNQLAMPSLIPIDIYEASGRKDNFGKNMFSLKDRYDREYALGPTHEELFVMAASMKIRSYKDMPFNIYQIASKYRDETRPRYGLIRVREFKMKDAYSFDATKEGLDKSYQKMYEAYKNIFDRLKLDYKIVKADTGVMGGELSEEYQAVSPIGEDVLVLCSNCDYSSNLEVSESIIKENPTQEEMLPYEEVYTPNVKTIKEVANYLNAKEDKFVKTLIYNVDNKLVACLIKGDRDLNEVKLRKLLNAKEVTLASSEDILNKVNTTIGYVGPINLNLPIIMDSEISNLTNFVTGANKENYHYKNVNVKDFNSTLIGDIKNVKEGDLCPKCGNSLIFKKGIEVGNIFKLGDKYSKSLNLKYLDKDNKENYVLMGCYGIGLDRVLAAIAEQHNDEKGLIWPVAVAPFTIGISVLDVNSDEEISKANYLYNELTKQGIDVILDDRNERIGVKFKDFDLIGIPYQIVIGKKISDGIVEFKQRTNSETKLLKLEKTIDYIKETLTKEQM